MGNFRKVIASMSVVAILSTLIVSVPALAADAFSDVSSSHWASSYVSALKDAGVVQGKAGKFDGDTNISRAEALKIALGANGIDSDGAGCSGLTFGDVKASDWFCDVVGTGVSRDVVKGKSASAFAPNDFVTRAEAAKMALLAAGVEVDEDCTEASVFSDAKTHWSKCYLNKGQTEGFWSGFSDGTYKPDQKITRYEFAKLGATSSGMVDADAGDDTTGDDTTGDDTTGDDTTGDDTTGDDTTGDDVVEATGGLTVAVSANTPAGDTIPDKATSVPVAAWDFTANDGDVEINAVSVHQYTVGTLPSAHQLYLFDGDSRLTSGASLNSTTLEARLSGLNFTVKDGETKTLVLRLDVGDGAATTKAGFEIASKEKVEITGADVSGTFPAQGDEFNLATDEVGTLTVEKNGTLTNPKVGEDGVTIAKFKMTTSGEGAVISRLGLLLTGTVSVNDAQNFKLYVSGTTDPIAEVAAVDSNDLINFTMPDAGYTIAKGDSKSFYINADFNTGRSSDSVKVYIDQDTDVVTTGDKYGFGLAITRTLYDGNPDACLNGSSNDCSYSSLQGGDITITTSGPAATNIAKNGKDVSLMEFSITSVSEVTFKKFPLSLTATEADATEGLMNATASNFTDIKITNVDTGKETFTAVDAGVFKTTIGGATAITEAAGDNAEAYHIFTDNVTIAAGETLNLKLTVDIANTDTLDGMTLIAQLPLGDSTSYPEVRDVNNKVLTNSSSLTPAADITAKTMTVKVPSLTLSLGSTPVVNGSNYVKGAKGVPFTGIVFACGDASSCKVTDVSLVGTVDETGATTAAATFPTTATNPGLDGAIQVNSIVGSVWLEDIDGNIVAAAKSVAANSGAVTFTNVNWTISAGSSPVLYVKGDISASAFKSSDADAVAFKVTAASSVTAEDKDGNSITPTGTVNHPSVTTASTWVVVLGGGSLTVAVDADTAQEDIILAGSTGVEVSKFKFTTTNEAFKVKALAINNRQSGATTATLGDYDNNVKQVTLSYTNSAGAAESKTASLVSGTANFSGLDFYIGKDNSAVITVKADTNTISSGSATAGEYVDMNLGFNNFEAIAQSSGETYKGDKIDATVSADSDLDFGTITWTDGTNIDINTAADIATATAGGTVTLTVNDETDGNPPNLPVGTLLCQDSSTTCSGKAVFVVTAWTEGSTFTDAGNTGDSITAIVLDNADTAVADADNLVYSLPGSGYLTSANRLHVYETRPTLALAAASPSGSRSTSSSDDAFVFTVNANVLEQVNLRAGTELTGTMLDGVGTPCAISTVTAAGLQVDGSAQLCTLDALAAGDSFSFATTAMTDYDRISFWINVVDTAGGTDSAFADYKVSTGTAQATFTAGTATALSQTICGADQATLTTAEWYFCDTQLPKDAGTLTHVHFEFDETTELADTDLVYIDEIWLYNDKIKIDIATDADLDTYANNATNAGSPVAVLLKEGSTTKATGYVTTTTNGASATSTGSITFIPTTQIEVAKNTTKTLTVNLNSGDLINEDTGSDDPVTFSIALGSSLEGTVTSGGFWWNDTNVDLDKNGTTTAAELTASAIKWVGKVSSTTLTGNTVKY